MSSSTTEYLFDGRWQGDHGIARYSRELLSRLHGVTAILTGPPPTHPLDALWTSWTIAQRRPKAYFSPGFNPPLVSNTQFAFTVHDLTVIRFAQRWKTAKRLYFEKVLRPAMHRAARVITVSQFSKTTLLEWASVPDEKIAVIPNGCSGEFSPLGKSYDPGFPYLLFVGNQKPHKNLSRILEAYAKSGVNKDVRFLLSGNQSRSTQRKISELGLSRTVQFTGPIMERDLPRYYRGAVALIYTTLYEGFGLPLLESMACGTPVLTSNVTALPEIAGSAALQVDPTNTDEIAQGIRQIVESSDLRKKMRALGLRRAANYNWSNSAAMLQRVLHELAYCS